jgi:hypothetical protein
VFQILSALIWLSDPAATKFAKEELNLIHNYPERFRNYEAGEIKKFNF